MQDGTKKKRVQGEAPRVTSCEAGGEHVLWRPVQEYCDRCRPDKTAADLERHRARRARLKAEKVAASAGGSAALTPVMIAEQQPPLTLADVLEAGLKLIEQKRVEVDERALAEATLRKKNGMSIAPAMATLNAYAAIHSQLTSARQLAAELGL